MVCRGLLLVPDRAGEIELPPVRRRVRNRLVERERPEPVIPDDRPVRGPLHSITPLEFVQVRRTAAEPLFNSLMEQYHYLGYEQPVGEHLKYLVKVDGQAIACLAWSSAPRHLKVRDRYIEWSDEARQRNVSLLAYNTRFLILPWVKVEHLASHILVDALQSLFPKTGNSSTRIRFIGWKPSWTLRAFAGRVIAQPTGK